MSSHRHIRLPRALLLWWSIWLLLSWLQSFGLQWSIDPTLDVYTVAVQRMLFLVGIGMAVIWPLYRLSLQNLGRSRYLALLDWLAMMAAVQVLVWSMRAQAQWSASETLLMDLVIAAWGLIIGGIISLGTIRHHGRTRIGAMVACFTLVIAGPFFSLLFATTPGSPEAGISAELLHWSPVSNLWLIVRTDRMMVSAVEWWRLAALGGVGMLIWIGVAMFPSIQTTTNDSA